MKFALSVLLCSAAFAAPTPRQMCLDALLEEYDSPVRETYTRDISAMNAAQIEALSPQLKQQLIHFAGTQTDCAGPLTVALAVECVRTANESRDEEFAYVYLTAPNGARFNRITFYPGAQDGVIYADKTTTVVAIISDGGVMCVE